MHYTHQLLEEVSFNCVSKCYFRAFTCKRRWLLVAPSEAWPRYRSLVFVSHPNPRKCTLTRRFTCVSRANESNCLAYTIRRCDASGSMHVFAVGASFACEMSFYIRDVIFDAFNTTTRVFSAKCTGTHLQASATRFSGRRRGSEDETIRCFGSVRVRLITKMRIPH